MSTATLHSEKKKTLAPQLRFQEFDGEWKLKSLRELSDLITKGTTPKKFAQNGIRFIKLECFEGDRINPNKCLFIDKSTHNKELKRSILNEGDILFAIAGATIGKVNIVTNEILPANTNQALSIVRLKANENKEFIYHNLISDIMRKYILDNISVGAQPNLNLEQMNNFSFFLPTLPEQKKIASFLSSVDEKTQQLSRKKELLEQYKKGVMQQLFSGKLHFKDENGEDYPDWEEKKLGDVADVSKLAGYEFTKHIVYEDKGEIIALRGLNIKNNKLDLKDVKYIDNSELSKLSRSKLYIDDLMFTYVGTIGEVALIKENDKYYLAPNVSRIRVNTKKIIPQYILQYFNLSKFRNNEIEKFISSSSQPALSMENIRKFKIPIPSIKEQQKIANFLSSIDTKIESVNQQLAQTQMFKKGLLQQMFV
jgi:type I restriction enzyme S subunit